MPDCYHIDFETYSPVDLPSCGAYAYAEQAEVLVLAIALNEGEPVLARTPEGQELIERLRADPNALVYAHNAQFERAIVRYAATGLEFLRDRPDAWRCTAAMARKASIPTSLEQCANYLGLEAKKDASGKQLIKLFSVPQKDGTRIRPEDRPEEFRQFEEYCLQDVRVEQQIHQALKAFEFAGITLEGWLVDGRMNDRGIPVDVAALDAAIDRVTKAFEAADREFRELTGLNVTQTQKLTAYFKLPNLQAKTVEDALKADPGNRPLALYSQVQFAAAKKVHAFRRWANSDGRMRGVFTFHGARTGRWSAGGPQMQNLKKPTIEHTELAYDCLKRGWTAEELGVLWDAPEMEIVASCIRHFVQDSVPLLDADFASIEARIVCWLAEQKDAIDRFRNGVDAYRHMAAAIFKRPAESFGAKSKERQLGKAAVLGCGFGMGASKFLSTCHAWGMSFVDDDLAEQAVQAYRDTHPRVRDLWYSCERAAKRAILTGIESSAGKLAYFRRKTAGKMFLFCRLPSGRCIAYPEPEVVDGRITFAGYPPSSQVWGRVETYGGKLVENATQAVAACCMMHGASQAMAKGFDLFALIHDQALASKRDGQTAKDFGTVLASLPDWATGLPLVAEAEEVRMFTK
jgi:DNA polymerase